MKGILFGYNPYSRNLLGINMKDIISLEVQYEEIPDERDGDGNQEVFFGYMFPNMFFQIMVANCNYDKQRQPN